MRKSMSRKILTSVLIVLFLVSIIPVLADEREEVDLTATVIGPPVADAGGPYFGRPGRAITFDGTWSYDPDGTIVKYEWDFGDGTTGEGPTLSHTYEDEGVYTVTLTVTDDNGLTGSDATTATVSRPPPPPPLPKNKKPKADAGPNQKAWVDRTVYFNGSESYDKDGYIVSYRWRFGDGTTASGVEVQHAYSEPGHYTVALTVKDDRGAEDSDTCKVKVYEIPASVVGEFAELIPAGKKGHIVNALKKANTTITLNTTGQVTVTVLKYDDNPTKRTPYRRLPYPCTQT